MLYIFEFFDFIYLDDVAKCSKVSDLESFERFNLDLLSNSDCANKSASSTNYSNFSLNKSNRNSSKSLRKAPAHHHDELWEDLSTLASTDYKDLISALYDNLPNSPKNLLYNQVRIFLLKTI